MARKFTPIERFVRKIDFNSSSFGCWIWQGSFGGFDQMPSHCYGRFWLNNKNGMAHRFSYEYFNNVIIMEGFHIDHLCKNPKCVNPNHLEMITKRENYRRADNPISIQSRKTHCLRGHILSGKNLYTARNGTRKCLKCIALRTEQFRKTGSYRLPDSTTNFKIWKED